MQRLRPTATPHIFCSTHSWRFPRALSCLCLVWLLAAVASAAPAAIPAASASTAGNHTTLLHATPPNATSASGRRRHFSSLDKEVVELLIKQWSPIVWLAPEEKFMPLAVEEFLDHVHPMDKGKTFIPGMPSGDYSKRAFLVTNEEVDKLLGNEKSFIYGRNPNEHPVPIYAVVSLCSEQPIEIQSEPATEAPPLPPQNIPLKIALTEQKPAATLTSTRGPYIPVSINPMEERNETIRRSSRLYPVFKRMRRDAMTVGEAANTSKPESVPENSGQVNNFIANLADNVKFSYTDSHELDNTINFENSFNQQTPESVIASRRNIPAFHVTYWMFYPYSQGKSMCTVSLGPLGNIPFPAVYGFCLGKRRDIGNHIGDWEHMSLFFNGDSEPESMYVSAHDAGAYYAYNRLTGTFEFKRQETRKGILQRPNFPKTVTTFTDHPVLFAAKGSHGLWTAPGKHRFVKVARLYDINGFGTPWNTWKNVDITYENLPIQGRSFIPSWLSFKGKWGNPKSKCHPFRRIGLNFCEYTDGPTGIPLKKPHFQCEAMQR